MMKMISLAVCVFGFSMMASANLDKLHEGPCKMDVETYCSNLTSGRGAILVCLKEHETKLKPKCVAHLKGIKRAMKDIKEACYDDFEKFCKDAKPGRGRIMNCMKQHKSALSEGCQAEMEEKKAARKKR